MTVQMQLTEWTMENLILRLVVAMVLGSLIGIDRGAKKRGGGARTDAAVCMGAAMVMMTAQYMDFAFPGKTDISRMAAQVISGVGFLGAGSIIVSGRQVKGLTSAASIWICACVGLAAGIGFVDGAVLVTVILLAGLHIIPLLEERVYQHSRYVRLYIEAQTNHTAPVLIHRMRADGCKIDMYDVEKSGAGGQSFTILITIYIPRSLDKSSYLKSLAQMEGVLSLDVL